MTLTEHRPAPLPGRAESGAGQVVMPGAGLSGMPAGTRWVKWYLDAQNKRHETTREVPVNRLGQLAGHGFTCPKCRRTEWLALDPRGLPICADDDMQMQPVVLRAPSLLPWGPMWQSVEPSLRPIWPWVAGFAGAAAIHDAGVTGYALAAAPVVPLAATAVSGWWLRRDEEDPDSPRTRRKVWRRARTVGYCTAAGCAWTALAAATGVDPTTAGGLIADVAWLPAVLVTSAPWWLWLHGQRRKVVPPVRVDAPEPILDTLEIDEREADAIQRWAQYVAAPATADQAKVRRLVGTTIVNFRRVKGGIAFTAVARPGTQSAEAFIGARGTIAGAFGVGRSAVTVDPDADDENRALVMIQRRSPLQDSAFWDGSGIDHATGTAESATMADGERVRHAFWRPGWGAVMELIAGCTGSGKSEYLNLLLGMERRSGVVVSWVGDPQLGQSLGDVRDGIDWFAPTHEEILLMLRCAKRVMLARNVLVARMRERDERGNERRVKYVEPSATFPLLSITIDEAHLPMSDPIIGKEIVQLLALISKSGRKANIKLRLILQSPLLSELKDSVLRGQLRSGLVTVFRIADRIDGGAAFPGRMPVDPASLPVVWPGTNDSTAGLCFQSGQRPMLMRTDRPGDMYDVMRDGPTLGLERAVLASAGEVYRDRSARLAEFDDVDPAVLLGMVSARSVAAPAGEDDSRGSCRETVLKVLAVAAEPVQFKELVAAAGFSTRTVSNVLSKLGDAGDVESAAGKHALTVVGRARVGGSVRQLELGDGA